jgi:hypothetical protein
VRLMGDLDSVRHVRQVKQWAKKERARLNEELELRGSTDGGLVVLDNLEAFLEGK